MKDDICRPRGQPAPRDAAETGMTPTLAELARAVVHARPKRKSETVEMWAARLDAAIDALAAYLKKTRDEEDK